MINKKQKERLKYLREAILCISIGTLVGLFVYSIFLYFNIAIFGWNFGLIFAPLTAGYVETIIAQKIIGEDIGAISAFVLFAYTTFYSFILKNTNLGFNLITIGSIFVILQSAFPTLINYLIIVVGVGTLSYLLGIFKRITSTIYDAIKNTRQKETIKDTGSEFDELQSNERINSLDFIFITSTDMITNSYENIGQYDSGVIIDIDKRLVHTEPLKVEKERLNRLKTGKDECIVKLAENIKSNGGNGVVDLEIHYGLIGLGGDKVQINATGMGVKIN